MPLSSCPDRHAINSLAAWETLAEQRIRAARDSGEFDNIERRGRPIILADNSYAETGLYALSGVFEEAGVRPAWIEESQEIRDEIRRARAKLSVTNNVQWARRRFTSLNKIIAAFNLVAPLLQFQLPFLNFHTEMARSGVITQ